ncbi:hypothetical protein [Pontibacillus halophilus]|nr:hypothetical protein [Pontibacillus halophilus]
MLHLAQVTRVLKPLGTVLGTPEYEEIKHNIAIVKFPEHLPHACSLFA